MTEVTITGIRVLHRPREVGHRGSSILAYFDCNMGGLTLLGCTLVRTGNRGLVANPPTIPGPEAQRRAVFITDNAMRHRLMEAARAAYKMLGGLHAEWEPTAGRADQGEGDE
ncbi:hypothetical protein ABNQ39_07020 [Azospirillum sp. A26]|uniref:hypothetical protein n=1 Tax=Azospirillum sp. A26 TaxID=3160607 RepID=UPI00366D76E0